MANPYQLLFQQMLELWKVLVAGVVVKDGKQFLRLPLESARKLRFYDRPDLSALIQANLREKQQLFDTNAALKQVCVSALFASPVSMVFKALYFSQLITARTFPLVPKWSVWGAFMQLLIERGVTEDEVEADLAEQLEDVSTLFAHDEGVNLVLLASAQSEVDALKNELLEQARQLAVLEER